MKRDMKNYEEKDILGVLLGLEVNLMICSNTKETIKKIYKRDGLGHWKMDTIESRRITVNVKVHAVL